MLIPHTAALAATGVGRSMAQKATARLCGRGGQIIRSHMNLVGESWRCASSH